MQKSTISCWRGWRKVPVEVAGYPDKADYATRLANVFKRVSSGKREEVMEHRVG
jgi:hypothetical protein